MRLLFFTTGPAAEGPEAGGPVVGPTVVTSQGVGPRAALGVPGPDTRLTRTNQRTKTRNDPNTTLTQTLTSTQRGGETMVSSVVILGEMFLIKNYQFIV